MFQAWGTSLRILIKHPKNWKTALWGKVRLYWKKSFIERNALLKERLYWKKGLIETNSKIWSKFQNLVQVLKFGWNSEIWPNIWNFAKNVKFGGNSEIWLKFGLESSKSTICPPPVRKTSAVLWLFLMEGFPKSNLNPIVHWRIVVASQTLSMLM